MLLYSLFKMLHVFIGVARGTGWQRLGAYVNLGSYYLVGIPSGTTIGFSSAYEGKGSLDWFSSRISGAKYSACYYNKFYQLEKRGSVFNLLVNIVFIEVSISDNNEV